MSNRAIEKGECRVMSAGRRAREDQLGLVLHVDQEARRALVPAEEADLDRQVDLVPLAGGDVGEFALLCLAESDDAEAPCPGLLPGLVRRDVAQRPEPAANCVEGEELQDPLLQRLGARTLYRRLASKVQGDGL